MLDRLGSLLEALQRCVAELDASELSGDEAMELCTRFALVERLGAAGRLMTAERVKVTEVWRRGGSRSAADWLARHTGAGPERARDGLEVAERLADCPVVAGEVRAGRLSESQASAIVDAVAMRPEVESRLVEFAGSNSLRRLREECRRLKNADDSAADEYKKVHAGRELKMWTGRDGAFCGSFRITADAGASFLAAVEARKDQHVKAARREGRREPFGAYAADALVELVTEERDGGGGRTRPGVMVVVHVAYESIARGALADGEVCEIRGVGPIPLEMARVLAADSILRVLVTKGGQPMAVTPGVRTVPRALRLLLEARDRTCIVPGCDVNRGLQMDHRKGFAQLGPTDLENCGLLCPRHHDMKTYLGWVLARRDDGSWSFTPPDDYRDPEPANPALGEQVFSDPWTGVPDRVEQPALAGAVGPSP
ncbi:MAG: HNH endonuclease [Actinobacteria bacterium]|nr:HNH endonuclease [Actinomycetota bacterium]